MIRKIPALFAALVFTATAINAADETTRKTGEPLKYQAYINSIISALPEIKANGTNVLSRENALKKAKSLEDFSLTGSGNYSVANQMNPLAGDFVYRAAAADLSMGLSKKIISTGTDVGVNMGYARNGYEDYPSISDTSIYSPFAGITVKQPLLYNFLGRVDRFSEKSAAMKLETEKVRLIENNKNTLNAYKKLYFEWMLTLKKIQNCRESIANSKAQQYQVGRNFKAGLVEEDDYQKTVASILEYEQQLENYMITLNNIVHQLSLYIKTDSASPSEEDFDGLFDDSLKAGFAYVDFSKTGSAKILDLTMKQLLYSKGVYENRLLPTLNVSAGVTRKNLTTDSSESFSDLSYSDWKLGFEFRYNLGNNSAESDLRDIEIQLKALEYERDSAVNAYKKNLSKLADLASGTKQLIEKKNAYLSSLKRRLQVEQRKYRQGRLNLSYVITTENSISAAMTDLFNLRYLLITYYIDYMDATK